MHYPSSYFTWLLATTTKICTQHRFCTAYVNAKRRLNLPTNVQYTLYPHSYIIYILSFAQDWILDYYYSAILFQGWWDWQVSCYTLLSGFQLPYGHRPTVYINQQLFWYPMCSCQAPYINDWLIPHRRFCLPYNL